MQFTTSQVNAALNLPAQTLRYWRTVLPPLKSKPGGKTARFSVGEILALAVVAKLVTDVRIDVGAIAPLSGALFELCRRPTAFAEAVLLCIDIEDSLVVLINEPFSAVEKHPLILVPIAQMSREITKLLIEPDDSEFYQREFPWPLTSVK